MPEILWLQRTSPAFRLLIATSWLAPASWQDRQEEAIREAIAAGPDWMEYIRLVDRHRLPALSWAALKRVPGLWIPESAKQELQKRSETCRMQAVRHCLFLAEALRCFNRAGIPAMPLKGPILSTELYGDVGLRQSHDLDLAVSPKDLSRAQACLEEIGWSIDPFYFPLTPRQWESFLQHEWHIGFKRSPGANQLELHWRTAWNSPNLIDARWARSISSVWQGCSYQAMNRIDQILYLCEHGGGHLWFRAKWLGDLARIHAQGQVDWEAALAEARSTGQERAVLACLRLLETAYSLPLPTLPGDPWKDLPSLLIAMPLRALTNSKELTDLSIRAMPWERLRMNRYQRQLLPRITWRESLSGLAYCRQDFKILRLPDRFFRAYALLRPILWAWRAMHGGSPAGEP